MTDEQKTIDPDDIGLHTLRPNPGSRKARKRVGRGEGSGTGKTSGRGQKGYGSRSGSKDRARFEGGQMPLHMRLRKLRGPHMKKSMPFEPFRTHTQPVNLGDLERRFDAGAEVTLEDYAKAGIAKRKGVPVKVLAKGDLSKALTVHAHAFSAGARERIESRTGVSAILENDVNLAAIAERSVRSTRDLSSFVYLWLGEGLGVGIDIDGEVQRGAFGGAGEVGYVEVPRSAASLDPDAMDFTDLLGGPAVRRLVGAAEDARLPDALAGLDTNEAALAALADRVALLASPVLAVLDPSAIVIGGPTGLAAGDGLAALVQERIADEPPPKAKPSQVRTHHRVSVHQSLAGGSHVLHGARRLLVTEIRDRLEAAIVVDAPAIG